MIAYYIALAIIILVVGLLYYRDYRADKRKAEYIAFLERGIDELKVDLANQVRATDDCEKRLARENMAITHDEYNKKHFLGIYKRDENSEYVKDEIPFAEEVDNIVVKYICPECGEPMTRETERLIFCDNPSCQRKQWRKDKLTEV